MENSYDQILGVPSLAENLSVGRAQELVGFLKTEGNPFVRLQECRSVPLDGGGSFEVVVLEVDVEVPQRPRHDIRPVERIGVRFSVDSLLPPEVLALRADFPLVPHLNLREEGFPRSLCLYDRPFHEVTLDWTPASFVERIREWLSLTAVGEFARRRSAFGALIPWPHVGSGVALKASNCTERMLSHSGLPLGWSLQAPIHSRRLLGIGTLMILRTHSNTSR